MLTRLKPQRAGEETQSDKEMGLLLRPPGPLIQLLLKLAGLVDYFGLLPKSMIEVDPLYSSVFLANLGLYWVLRGVFLPLWAVAPLSPALVPGILFLVCWWRGRSGKSLMT